MNRPANQDGDIQSQRGERPKVDNGKASPNENREQGKPTGSVVVTPPPPTPARRIEIGNGKLTDKTTPNERIYDGSLTIVAFRVGEGDCTAIICPSGDIFMVDIGSTQLEKLGDVSISPKAELSGDRYFGKDKRLAGLILTHSDKDHYNMVKTLQELEVAIRVVYHSNEFRYYKCVKDNTTRSVASSELIRMMCESYMQKDEVKPDKTDDIGAIRRLSLSADFKTLRYEKPKGSPAPSDETSDRRRRGVDPEAKKPDVVYSILDESAEDPPGKVGVYSPKYGLRIHREEQCEIYLLCGDVRVPLDEQEVDVTKDEQGTPIKRRLRGTEVPVKTNMGSIVVLVRHFNGVSGSQSLHMICGDANGGTEDFIMQRYPDLKDLGLLRIAHHGSATENSSQELFLKRMNPQWAIISAPSFENGYGLPDDAVVQRIEAILRKKANRPEGWGDYWAYDTKLHQQKPTLKGDFVMTGSHGDVVFVEYPLP